MNKKTRNATLLGLAAGIALIPIIRAVVKRYRSKKEEPRAYEGAPPNHIFSAYRGRHKPHHRKSGSNGVH